MLITGIVWKLFLCLYDELSLQIAAPVSVCIEWGHCLPVAGLDQVSKAPLVL